MDDSRHRPLKGALSRQGAITLKCRQCLCLKSRERGFDCQDPECALYPYHPYKGQPIPKKKLVSDSKE